MLPTVYLPFTPCEYIYDCLLVYSFFLWLVSSIRGHRETPAWHTRTFSFICELPKFFGFFFKLFSEKHLTNVGLLYLYVNDSNMQLSCNKSQQINKNLFDHFSSSSYTIQNMADYMNVNVPNLTTKKQCAHVCINECGPNDRKNTVTADWPSIIITTKHIHCNSQLSGIYSRFILHSVSLLAFKKIV